MSSRVRLIGRPPWRCRWCRKHVALANERYVLSCYLGVLFSVHEWCAKAFRAFLRDEALRALALPSHYRVFVPHASPDRLPYGPTLAPPPGQGSS